MQPPQPSDNHELIAHAELGEEARKFVESDLYRCIVGIAEQEISLAHEKLEEVDAENTLRIRELQNEIARYRKFERWLNELVAKGSEALVAWKQRQEQ